MTRRAPPKVHPRKARAKRSGKAGMPPGSLVLVGEKKIERSTVTLLEYDAQALRESCFADIAASKAHVPALPKLWLNVHGLHELEVLQEIGRRFGLHPLVLEDVLNTEQRPKIDDYGDYLFIIARFFDYDAQTLSVSSEQVSLVIGQDFVLSFQERPTGNFEPVREWLRNDRGQIRRLGTDYLAYALLDTLVDRYFEVIEQIGERTEQLEDDLLADAGTSQLQTLHQLKRETLTLRRAIWPLREVINTLLRNEQRFFTPDTQLYLRDIYDHSVHLIESLEAIRDLIAGMLDIYLSSISNKVNREVRALTVVALIFMPATLVSGIFGMNFHTMPLLDHPDGFWIALSIMLCIAVTLGGFLWRQRWLDS